MKSMSQMQNEMLAKARFDGGWPRAVCLPMGVIALAKNEAELESLMRENERVLHVALWALVVGGITTLVSFVWLLWSLP